MVLLLHLFLLLVLLLLLLLSIRQFVTPQLNCALCWSRTNPSTAEWLYVLYFVCSSTRPSASARIQNYKTVHCKDPQQQFSPFCNSLQPTPNQKHRFLWSGGFACALWLLIVLSSFLLFPAYVSLNVLARPFRKPSTFSRTFVSVFLRLAMKVATFSGVDFENRYGSHSGMINGKR